MRVNQLRNRTEQIRKGIYASKSPCSCPSIYALAIPEATGTSKTSIDQSTSRLDPPFPLPPHSAGSQLQEQKHITHQNSRATYHISRACPLTQFTHPPKATTQLLDVLNRTKHVPRSTTKEPDRARSPILRLFSLLGLLACSAIGHAAANRPNQAPLFRTEKCLPLNLLANLVDRAAVAPILPRGNYLVRSGVQQVGGSC